MYLEVQHGNVINLRNHSTAKATNYSRGKIINCISSVSINYTFGLNLGEIFLHCHILLNF